MIFIAGLITGFVLFPVVSISAILIYGFRAEWDKPPKKEQQLKGLYYHNHRRKKYINKKEINKIINKSKLC